VTAHAERDRLRPPAPVVELAATLQQAGFEAWCVGGAVRDALLGHAHLDWDLATSATPRQVQRLFRRTVPVGIEFGTVGVMDRDGRMHEVTTFRRDVHTDGRHAVVEFGVSLNDDLARRDFTINAIAWDPIAETLHDPFGGRDDLSRGVVRAVGTASERLTEDRLRALRAIRFASRFGFALDDATWQAVVESAPHLGRLSPERVKQELEKTMEQVDRPSLALQRWRDAGAFAVLIPALASVSNAQTEVVDRLPKPGLPTRPLRKALRLAALFAGLDGKRAEQALRALRFSNLDISTVGALVDRWHREGPSLTGQLVAAARPDDASLRRLAARVGRLRMAAFMRLAAAHWAVRDEVSPAAWRALHRRVLRIAFRDAIEVGDLAIDGDDLRRLGVKPGPLLGQLLHEMLEAVLVDPARNTVSELNAMARARLDAGPSPAGGT
jgi:tRNA nucleotidyltransferase (CCA-adding enzyme)